MGFGNHKTPGGFSTCSMEQEKLQNVTMTSSVYYQAPFFKALIRLKWNKKFSDNSKTKDLDAIILRSHPLIEKSSMIVRASQNNMKYIVF